MDEQKVLFDRLRQIKDYWSNLALKSINNECDMIWSQCKNDYELIQSLEIDEEVKEALYNIINELIKNTIHSILVMIDGGDNLTDKITIDLINSDTNTSLRKEISLNSAFIEYLLDIQ